MIPDDVDEPEGILTLRIGVTLVDGEEDHELGPRIVHEVPARTLFDHVADLEAIEGDAFPRFELTLWDETELERWPLDVVAIPREIADVLLDGELDDHLLGLLLGDTLDGNPDGTLAVRDSLGMPS